MAAWGSAAREASLYLFLMRCAGNRTHRRRSLSAGGSPVKIPGTKPWQPGDNPAAIPQGTGAAPWGMAYQNQIRRHIPT